MSLKDKIKKSRNIKDSSLNTYLSSLRKLRNKLDSSNSKEELNSVNFLKDFKKVMIVIDEEKKITSKKNKLTSILVALNSEENKDTDLIDKYGNELKTLGEKYLSFLRQQKKTETQEKNWLDYNELINIVNKVMREVKHRGITKKKSDDDLTNKEFDILQQYVILRTYLTFPLRNDFADMKVLKLQEYKQLDKSEKEDNNYLLLLSNNKKQFNINQFKNKKFIGSKVLKVPSNLNRVINLWLKHNKSGWYLVKCDRKRPMNPNSITKFLNKIFIKYANGKKISSSMIRHIMISHILKNEPTIKEKEEEANEIENKFLHSKNINDLYRKIDKDIEE